MMWGYPHDFGNLHCKSTIKGSFGMLTFRKPRGLGFQTSIPILSEACARDIPMTGMTSPLTQTLSTWALNPPISNSWSLISAQVEILLTVRPCVSQSSWSSCMSYITWTPHGPANIQAATSIWSKIALAWGTAGICEMWEADFQQLVLKGTNRERRPGVDN